VVSMEYESGAAQLKIVMQHLYRMENMISLADSIEIQTTPSRLFSWLANMPKEYLSWHKDHVSFRVIHGSMLEVGSEIECEEYLHGKLHSMRFRMTKVVPDERLEFAIEGLGRGAFLVHANGDTVRFVAELDIGSDTPIIGTVFNFLFSRFFGKRIDAMRQHMVEEGENLKAILES
jgi:hypothetical protein